MGTATKNRNRLNFSTLQTLEEQSNKDKDDLFATQASVIKSLDRRSSVDQRCRSVIGKLESSMERQKKQHRAKRNTSTFSTYYLNDNTKDLMNINSCSVIGGEELTSKYEQATI